MTPVAGRRSPNTFRIYGMSGLAIVAWWAVLWVLGVSEEPEGEVLLAVVAVLALIPALVRDPFGILCLVVFALPFSFGILQFEVGVITLNPYTTGVIAAAAIAIGAMAMGVVRYRPTGEDLVVLLLGASFLLSTLLAPDLIESGFLAFHGIFIPISTYFAVRILVRSPSHAQKVLVAYIAGATAFAVYGIIQFAQTPERLFVLNMPPISAAAVMVSALITLIFTGWWRSLLGRAASLALFVGVVVTFSRGYLILLFLAPLFFRGMTRGRAGTLMASMLVATLVATLLFARSYEFFQVEDVDRTQEQTAQRISDFQYWMSSLAGRAAYYSIGLEEFAKSPLIGNGFHKGFEGPGGSAVVWHNFHVEWLEYGGISAYLLYMSLLILHFRGVSTAARWNRQVATGLTVIFVVLLNGLMNSFTAGISPVLGFLFMALNRAALSGPPGQPQEGQPAGRRRSWAPR